MGDDFGAGMYRGAVEKFCGEMGLGYRNETAAGRRPPKTRWSRWCATSTPTRPCRASCRCGPSRAQISDSVVINSIDVDKDVDCFHPFNMGRLTLGEPTFPPATPAACMELLERYLRAEGRDVTEALEGAEVCVVGHSNIVGKPLALLLLNRNATTTVTHVFTSNRGNLEKHTAAADFLVVAAGVPASDRRSTWSRKGAVVLDVGINRVVVCPACGDLQPEQEEPLQEAAAPIWPKRRHKTVGDVDFEAVSAKAGAITPVPGGVGAVTNMMLARNTLRAARHATGRRSSRPPSRGREVP